MFVCMYVSLFLEGAILDLRGFQSRNFVELKI